MLTLQIVENCKIYYVIIINYISRTCFNIATIIILTLLPMYKHIYAHTHKHIQINHTIIYACVYLHNLHMYNILSIGKANMFVTACWPCLPRQGYLCLDSL
jgi:hypothetical protein